MKTEPGCSDGSYLACLRKRRSSSPAKTQSNLNHVRNPKTTVPYINAQQRKCGTPQRRTYAVLFVARSAEKDGFTTRCDVSAQIRQSCALSMALSQPNVA
jgi:hypothetical protein